MRGENMGIYVNPNNIGFEQTVNSQIYVDKTGMIKYLNQCINTEQKFICVSRARRFGKSVTAGMIKAYYSKGCDSSKLFAGREIEKDSSYKKYLNKYDVIHVDMAEMWVNADKKPDKFLPFMKDVLFSELEQEYPSVDITSCTTLAMALAEINNKLGLPFVIIFDEWDTVFREAKYNEALQEEYISMLRALFKSESAKSFVALAYITGILPIKKYGIESALNNFGEYTMINPLRFAKYYGFTDKEVRDLCEKYDMDYNKMQDWYVGYSFEGEQHVYNPNSVVHALMDGVYKSYWSNTEAFSSLQSYISMNFEGLRDDIIRMFAGERCRVRVGNFANDLVSYKSKNDVMTAMIHLGYLTYDSDTKEAYIPNAEVQEAFEYAIEGAQWDEVIHAVDASDRLLRSTWQQDAEAVAEAMEKVHSEAASILQYNDENSLSCAITLAYYNARNYYNIVREMPMGRGYADLVFISKKNKDVPAMIIELKCNQAPEEAIAQIKERKYMDGLKEYQDNMLLVGINYDKQTKKHSCVIEWYKE